MIVAGSCVLALVAPRAAQADAYRFQRDGFEIGVVVEAAGFEGPYPLNHAVVSAAKGDTQSVAMEFDLGGELQAAWVTDLDGNSRPEVLLWVRTHGSGGYGGLRFVDVDAAGMVVRELPALELEYGQEYRGHDRFTVATGSLVRHFPVYGSEDANCCPSRGEAEVSYGYDGDVITVRRMPSAELELQV